MDIQRRNTQGYIGDVRRPKDVRGYVYIVSPSKRDFQDNIIKIGRTGDLKTRFTDAKVFCPDFTIFYSRWCSDAYKIEAVLHLYFRDCRLKGECFVIPPQKARTVLDFLIDTMDIPMTAPIEDESPIQEVTMVANQTPEEKEKELDRGRELLEKRKRDKEEGRIFRQKNKEEYEKWQRDFYSNK